MRSSASSAASRGECAGARCAVGVVLDDVEVVLVGQLAAPGAPHAGRATRRSGCAAPRPSRRAAAARRPAAPRSGGASPPRRGRRAPRGTGSTRMPSAASRAYSTDQPGSSTSTLSPARSRVRVTMSSAWVAPTVVTICSGAGGDAVVGELDRQRLAQPQLAGRVAVLQRGLRRPARPEVALRIAAASIAGSSHSAGRVPRPGIGLPPGRLEHAADQRGGAVRHRLARRRRLRGAASAPRSRRARRRRSRTKKPRCGRASTRPRASSWS